MLLQLHLLYSGPFADHLASPNSIMPLAFFVNSRTCVSAFCRFNNFARPLSACCCPPGNWDHSRKTQEMHLPLSPRNKYKPPLIPSAISPAPGTSPTTSSSVWVDSIFTFHAGYCHYPGFTQSGCVTRKIAASFPSAKVVSTYTNETYLIGMVRPHPGLYWLLGYYRQKW